MVIFGAAGDLTKRLVVPALYNLALAKLLPEEFAIIGFDRVEISDEQWRNSLAQMTEEFVKAGGDSAALNQDAWKWLAGKMSYMKGDLTDSSAYQQLKTKLDDLDKSNSSGGNYLFYLAVSDRFFGSTIDQLGKACLSCQTEGHWRRVVIEKPFGHDLQSAEDLDQQILRTLQEQQIFRIDHFLGKETVQNIMTFRFANGLFEPLWNRDRIDHVQITVSESVGVEKRGKFYEGTGALRDMIPNHVFQLVAMTAMEAPNSFAADAIRSEKAKVIEAVHVCDSKNNCGAVRAQYKAGEVGGQPVPAYRSEPDVSPDSPIETYVALKLMIDNWRWSGVPFYVRTGKRMARRKTHIAIKFKGVPGTLLREMNLPASAPNWLLLRIQPDEGIALEFGAKIPGPSVRIGDVRMDFKYEDYFGAAPNTGYETLLYDVMVGDATLFQRADNIEAGWSVVQPLLNNWSKSADDLAFYDSGSQGPAEADQLLACDGRAWRPIN